MLKGPEHPEVKLLLPDGKIIKLSATDALRLALKSEYEWCGSKRRVRAIRPLSKAPAWQHCHRTTSAASLPPSVEWLNSRRSC